MLYIINQRRMAEGSFSYFYDQSKSVRQGEDKSGSQGIKSSIRSLISTLTNTALFKMNDAATSVDVLRDCFGPASPGLLVSAWGGSAVA